MLAAALLVYETRAKSRCELTGGRKPAVALLGTAAIAAGIAARIRLRSRFNPLRCSGDIG